MKLPATQHSGIPATLQQVAGYPKRNSPKPIRHRLTGEGEQYQNGADIAPRGSCNLNFIGNKNGCRG